MLATKNRRHGTSVITAPEGGNRQRITPVRSCQNNFSTRFSDGFTFPVSPEM